MVLPRRLRSVLWVGKLAQAHLRCRSSNPSIYKIQNSSGIEFSRHLYVLVLIRATGVSLIRRLRISRHLIQRSLSLSSLTGFGRSGIGCMQAQVALGGLRTVPSTLSTANYFIPRRPLPVWLLYGLLSRVFIFQSLTRPATYLRSSRFPRL